MLMGHTAFGMDLAPSLMDFPLVIDCIGLSLEGNRLKGIRSVYGGIEAPITGENITQVEIIIAVGQGIGGPEHIPLFEELAKNLGGTISCSRPVVDRNWLPKERQVGISGMILPRI